MSIAALIRAMSSAGAPPEAIALAVEAIEAAEKGLADKRAVERDRKRAQRQRERDSHGTVTGQAVDKTDKPAPSPSFPPDPLTNPTPTREDTPRARKAGAWPVPDGVEPRHWSDFLANRKRKRLVNSQTALDGVLRDLAENADEHWPPGRLVEHAAAKGWGSINYPSDQPKNGVRHEPVRSNCGSAPRTNDGFLNAIRESGERRRAANC